VIESNQQKEHQNATRKTTDTALMLSVFEYRIMVPPASVKWLSMTIYNLIL